MPGIMQQGLVSVADTDDALFDRLFAINVKGTFNTLRLAAKRLRQGGRIVNFSTSVVGLALPGYAPYAATKSAVETLTNIFAKELRGREISVNAVASGPTATDLFFNGKHPSKSRTCRRWRRWNVWVVRKTSPASSHSSWVPMELGSTDKPCERTEVSSEDSNS